MVEYTSATPGGGDIDAEALAWLTRMTDPVTTPDDRAAFEAWLSSDRRHRGAYVRAQAAWHLLGSPPDIADLTVEEEASESQSRSWRPSRRGLLGGGSAAIAAAIMGTFGVQAWLDRRGQTYATGLGEIRHQPLPDGSVVVLNTNSAVNVRFDADRRIVRLVSGEAWFEVAKDWSRPFIVDTGGVQVRAVGTTFSVQSKANGTDILVTEGVVELSGPRGLKVPVHLQAGAEAGVRADGSVDVAVLQDDALMRRLAWREGALALNGETLAHAAAELNRYNPIQINVVDDQLARQPIVGWFRVNDPEGFARSVAQMFDANLRREGMEIQIVSRPSEKI